MKINDYSSTGPVRGANRAMPAAAFRSVRKAALAEVPSPSANAAISSPAQLLSRAVERLRERGEIRGEAVAAARESLRDWRPLEPGQIGQIADDLLAERS